MKFAYHKIDKLFVLLTISIIAAALASDDANCSWPAYFADGTIHIISSSHQDIGWEDTPENCAVGRDLHVITPAIERLEQNPDFRFSNEDVHCLAEYLGRRPEAKEKIRQLTKAGKLEWGATYNQPYESLYTGEALVRQVYLGRKWFKDILPGCDSRIAWSVDVPGRAAQMPQILAKAGIEYMQFSQCETGLYKWFSPDDSSILAFSSGHYYTSGEPIRRKNNIPNFGKAVIYEKDFAQIAASFKKLLNDAESYYADHNLSPQFACISSTDFSGPADIDNIIEKWNAARKENPSMPKMKYSTGTEFCQAISQGNPDPIIFRGERPNLWLYIHGPTHERAVTIGRRAWRLLTAAEKFATIDATLAGTFKDYPQEKFDRAWADAIYPDHGWGGKNGHITDKVFKNSLLSARDAAADILNRSLTSIAARVRHNTDGIPITVFNDLSWQRTDPVTCTVNVEGKAYPYQQTDINYKLVDYAGQEIPHQVIADKKTSPKDDDQIHILFIAEDVPSVGYKTYYLVPKDPNAKDQKQVTSSQNKLENSFYRIDLASGAIKQIYDKQLKRNLLQTDKFLGAELFTMHSPGTGAGGFAEVMQPTMEGFDKLSNYSPAWICTEAGPVRITFETAQIIDHCTIRLKVSLYHDIKRIDCDVDILAFDGTRHREFRLAFPLNLSDAKVTYESPMAIIEVGAGEIDQAVGERYTQHCAEVRPREVQDFIAAHDDNAAVTISSSVSVFDYKDPTDSPVSYPVIQPVLLSSRRSCNPEGNWYLQPGDHSYQFSFFSHRPSWKNGYRLGKQANRPLFAFTSQTTLKTPCLPEQKSFCSVEPQNVIISTIKKCADDDNIVLRCYEIQGRDCDASIRWFAPISGIELTDIIEENPRPASISKGSIKARIGHNAIETFKLISEQKQAKH